MNEMTNDNVAQQTKHEQANVSDPRAPKAQCWDMRERVGVAQFTCLADSHPATVLCNTTLNIRGKRITTTSLHMICARALMLRTLFRQQSP